MNRILLFFIALLLLLSGASVFWYAAQQSQPNLSGTLIENDPDYIAPEKEITEFEFTDQFAKPFGTKDLLGKVWLGSFFFSECPSICPQQNAEIAKLQKRFADDDVMIVNITVTPDKDPPHTLWAYANRFDADHDRWKFLTGRDIDYVRQVGIDIFSLPAADETHTSEVAVFDRNGTRHGSYNVNKPMEAAKFMNKVEELLAQPMADNTATRETSAINQASPSNVGEAPPNDGGTIAKLDLSNINVRGAWATIIGLSLAAVGLLVWIIYFKEQPAGSEETLVFLPLLNCILNGSSACCLIIGLIAIKQGNTSTHVRWMIGAFACSTVFLVSYILHHHLHGDTKFPESNGLRPFYLLVLASHILLSVIALPMILMTFFLALSGRFAGHKRLARFTFPIWLYVSVTGVLIFVLLRFAEASS